LRRGLTSRRTWWLDITSDLGVPAVVALSCNDDGFGLCVGHAARATLAEAADAAVMEMAQMEVAHRLSTAKRIVRGDTALNEIDWRHIHRYTAINVAETPALHPLAPPAGPRDLLARDGVEVLREVRRWLEAAGLTPCAVDLTRDIYGIPVSRVLCAGLEPGLSSPAGPRLTRSARAAGIDLDRFDAKSL
jgi:ribosomal protein S12 methylthiotransferase accessory factor